VRCAFERAGTDGRDLRVQAPDLVSVTFEREPGAMQLFECGLPDRPDPESVK
jgi:hypothetical protein